MTRISERPIKYVEQVPIRMQATALPAFDSPVVLPTSISALRADHLEVNSNYAVMLNNVRKIPALYRRQIERGDFGALEEFLQYMPEASSLQWVRDASDRAQRQQRNRRGRGRPLGGTEATRNLARMIGPLVEAIRRDENCSVAEAVQKLAAYQAVTRDGVPYRGSRGLSASRLSDLYHKERPRDGARLPYAVRHPSRARIVATEDLYDRPIVARPGQVLGWRPQVLLIISSGPMSIAPKFTVLGKVPR